MIGMSVTRILLLILSLQAGTCGLKFDGCGEDWKNDVRHLRCEAKDISTTNICKGIITSPIPLLRDKRTTCLILAGFFGNTGVIGRVYRLETDSATLVCNKVLGPQGGNFRVELPNMSSHTQVFVQFLGGEKPTTIVLIKMEFIECGDLPNDEICRVQNFTGPMRFDIDSFWENLPGCETTTPIPETTTPIAETTTPMSCYLTSEGKCFQYFDVPRSHQDAQKNCKAIGGKLPEPRSESTKDDLMAEVKTKNLQMWIGANDLEKEGTFVWESDNQTIPKTWWIRGEPNNWRGRENCVMMKPPSGKLNDAFCRKKLTFFCEV